MSLETRTGGKRLPQPCLLACKFVGQDEESLISLLFSCSPPLVGCQGVDRDLLNLCRVCVSTHMHVCVRGRIGGRAEVSQLQGVKGWEWTPFPLQAFSFEIKVTNRKNESFVCHLCVCLWGKKRT